MRETYFGDWEIIDIDGVAKTWTNTITESHETPRQVFESVREEVRNEHGNSFYVRAKAFNKV